MLHKLVSKRSGAAALTVPVLVVAARYNLFWSSWRLLKKQMERLVTWVSMAVTFVPAPREGRVRATT
jgi:hypothetical protein